MSQTCDHLCRREADQEALLRLSFGSSGLQLSVRSYERLLLKLGSNLSAKKTFRPKVSVRPPRPNYSGMLERYCRHFQRLAGISRSSRLGNTQASADRCRICLHCKLKPSVSTASNLLQAAFQQPLLAAAAHNISNTAVSNSSVLAQEEPDEHTQVSLKSWCQMLMFMAQFRMKNIDGKLLSEFALVCNAVVNISSAIALLILLVTLMVRQVHLKVIA